MSIFEEKIKFIDEAVANFEKQVPGMEKELMNLIRERLIDNLVYDENGLSQTPTNIQLVSVIDDIYAEFSFNFQAEPFKELAKNLLKVTNYNKAYYTDDLDFSKTKINAISTELDGIKKMIGFDGKKISKGSYLDIVSQGSGVKEKLKQYVIESIISKKGSKEFAKGFKEIVQGGKGKTGLLDRYHKQYTYDVLNKVDAAENKFMASELDLQFFRYEGTLIKTSREFCRKRVGQVFHVKETEDWKNDPDLIEPSTKDSYNPLVERGRYNCRHFIRYITDEKAEQLDPDKYDKYANNKS